MSAALKRNPDAFARVKSRWRKAVVWPRGGGAEDPVGARAGWDREQPSPPKSQPAAADSQPELAEQKGQKLLAALMAQGFKRAESKQIVTELARDATTSSLEELLRRAFALLAP